MLPLSRKWHDVYHLNLLTAFLAKDFEFINHTFVLDDPQLNTIESDARGFRQEFSDVMFNWIMSGEVEISDEMIALNPNAKKFATEHNTIAIGNIVTAYGPRIVSQWDHVKNELQRDPNSRRACIMMLQPADLFIAEAMAKGETKCEYICTYGFNFRIREGKLDLHVSMRSNNYTTTVCQDVYIFTKIQKVMADELGLEVGKYYHHAVSAHILPTEIKRAHAILEEYVLKNSEVASCFFGSWQRVIFQVSFETRTKDLIAKGVL